MWYAILALVFFLGGLVLGKMYGQALEADAWRLVLHVKGFAVEEFEHARKVI